MYYSIYIKMCGENFPTMDTGECCLYSDNALLLCFVEKIFLARNHVFVVLHTP
jgi:hypothetical protein